MSDEERDGREGRYNSERSDRKKRERSAEAEDHAPSSRRRRSDDRDRRPSWEGRGGGRRDYHRRGGGWGGRGGGRGGFGGGGSWHRPPVAAPPVKMTFKEFLGRQPGDVTPEDAQKRYDAYCEGFAGELVRSYFDRHQETAWVREKYDPLTIRQLRDAATSNPVEAAATFASGFDANAPSSWPSYAYDGPPPRVADPNDTGDKPAGDKPADDKGAADPVAADTKPDLDKPLEAEAAPVDPDSPAGIAARTLFVPALPRTLTRPEATELFAKQPGFVEVHGPYETEPRLTRRLWATYTTKEDAQKAHQELDKKLVHPAAGERLQVRFVAPRRWPPAPRLRLVPPEGHARLEKDIEQSTAVMKALDTIAGVEENPVLVALEDDSATPEQKLDLVLWYLREVHRHCYYTCTKLWWQWETQRRPPAPEVESETSSAAGEDGAPSTDAGPDESTVEATNATAELSETLEKPDLDEGEVAELEKPKVAADSNENKGGKKQKKSGGNFGDRLGLGFDVHGLSNNWQDTLDKRCAKLIASATAAISEAEYLAKFDAKYEEAVVKFCEDNMREDEKGKWRCLLPPNKLFESPAFVTKHIRNKQQDKLEAVAKRVSKSMALERFTADSGRDMTEPHGQPGGGRDRGGRGGGRGMGMGYGGMMPPPHGGPHGYGPPPWGPGPGGPPQPMIIDGSAPIAGGGMPPMQDRWGRGFGGPPPGNRGYDHRGPPMGGGAGGAHRGPSPRGRGPRSYVDVDAPEEEMSEVIDFNEISY